MWSFFWILVAVLLGVAEAFTMTLAFAFVAGGALLAAGSAALGAPVLVQLLVFVVAGGGSVLLVRPVARRHMSLPPAVRDGTDALIGRQAVVTAEVSFEHGLVRLAGEEWSARPYDEDLIIPVGCRVDVLEIEGATALVHPRDPLSLSP
ncbi:NfeD family protein [Nocardioides sp. NPDC101246]|uniref:NfeD family protein n=1 Tax=unclassified Nocardioides TaxID=2615069 RepID=UPI000880628C|nr:NfeD family protein [Nocardioides sp. YR527]SDK93327.1 Membrane protein implicated in regulation of membrane protease activity [Nocardioides sp. YR527]